MRGPDRPDEGQLVLLMVLWRNQGLRRKRNDIDLLKRTNIVREEEL